MKTLCCVLGALGGLLVLQASGDDAAQATGPATQTPPPAAMSQGDFALQVIRRAHAERFFPRTVTGTTAAEKLASLGFAPQGGWQTEDPLTWDAVESAYHRLLRVVGVENEEPQGADLAAKVVADAVAPAEGGSVGYRVSILNKGPAKATNVKVAMVLPAGLTFDAADSPDYANGVWTLKELAPAASAELALKARVNTGTAGRRSWRALAPPATSRIRPRATTTPSRAFWSREGACRSPIWP